MVSYLQPSSDERLSRPWRCNPPGSVAFRTSPADELLWDSGEWGLTGKVQWPEVREHLEVPHRWSESLLSPWPPDGEEEVPELSVSYKPQKISPKWEGKRKDIEAGDFEPITSGLCTARALAEQIMIEVDSGLCRSRDQLVRVFAQSLAAYQGKMGHFDEVFDEMVDSGMLWWEEQEDVERAPLLRVSSWGRIAVRQMLAPATMLHFRRLLEATARPVEWTFFDLLLINFFLKTITF